MKILHLSTGKSWRGGEQQILYLVEGLSNKGVESSVLSIPDTPLHNKLVQAGYGVKTYKGKWSLPRGVDVIRFAKDSQAALIHAHDSHSLSAAVIAANLGCTTPIIASRRVARAAGSSWLSRKKYGHPSVAKIICVSHFVKVANAQYIDPAKLVVVYSGVDVSSTAATATKLLQNEYKLPQDAVKVGYIAALSPEKDYLTFLEAAKFILSAKPALPIYFFLVGQEGRAAQEVKEGISANPSIESRFIITGFRADVKDVLSDLDILMFTSKSEGLGSSILDAYVRRVAVVATGAGGIPEVVKHRETGMLAQVGKAEEVGSYVLELLDDEALRMNLVENAAKAVQNFSVQNMVDRTLAIYQEVLNLKAL